MSLYSSGELYVLVDNWQLVQSVQLLKEFELLKLVCIPKDWHCQFTEQYVQTPNNNNKKKTSMIALVRYL